MTNHELKNGRKYRKLNSTEQEVHDRLNETPLTYGDFKPWLISLVLLQKDVREEIIQSLKIEPSIQFANFLIEICEQISKGEDEDGRKEQDLALYLSVSVLIRDHLLQDFARTSIRYIPEPLVGSPRYIRTA